MIMMTLAMMWSSSICAIWRIWRKIMPMGVEDEDFEEKDKNDEYSVEKYNVN